MDENFYPMPQAILGHTTEGSLQFQLEIDKLIEDIVHNVKGEMPKADENSGEIIWERPEDMPQLINQKGVNSIITHLRLRLSKVFVLSDFEENDIYDIMKTCWNDMTDDFYFNWNEYEIKDTSSASIIKHMVCDAIFATLRKAHNKNYLKFLSTTTSAQEIQHRAIQERDNLNEQQGNDPLNFIFGRKKRR